MPISPAVWKVLVDWSGDGTFTEWNYPGGSAVQVGASGSNYWIVADADASDLAVGNLIMHHDGASGAVDNPVPYRITSISAPAFGYRNVFVERTISPAGTNNDTIRVVTSTGENVTARQMKGEGINVGYGRDTARSLAPPRVGTASFSLDNTSGDYSPEKPTSPLAGNLLVARPVLIQCTHLGVVYTLYRGQTDEQTPNYGRISSVNITCMDVIGQLAGTEVSVPLAQGIRTGDAMHMVLDAAGWTGGRDIDPGATQLAFYWDEGVDALEAIKKLLESEGMPAFVGGDGNGNFVFRDRHHRLIRPASMTNQSTIRETGTDPRLTLPLEYTHGFRDVINAVSFSVPIRKKQAQGVVWTLDDGLSLQDGQTLVVEAQSSDPFDDAVVPVNGLDYSLHYGSINVSLTRRSGAAVGIVIAAVGGPAELDSLRLRARPVTVAATVKVTLEDGASIARYGRRGSDSLDPKWCGPGDALAIAQLILSYRSERRPTIRVRLTSGTDAILAEQLKRNISDRIRVIYGTANIDDSYYVEKIDHTVRGAGSGRIVETIFECEEAPAPVANGFILNSSVLGTGILNSYSFTDPATVMVLDSTTAPLNTGALAY